MSDGEFQLPNYFNMDIPWSEQVETFLKTKPMTGVELIAQERLEQKVKHGRSVKFDVENNPDEELRFAAIGILLGDSSLIPEEWDPTIYNKILRKPYKERLIIAGALIAAEIDRLNYKA